MGKKGKKKKGRKAMSVSVIVLLVLALMMAGPAVAAETAAAEYQCPLWDHMLAHSHQYQDKTDRAFTGKAILDAVVFETKNSEWFVGGSYLTTPNDLFNGQDEICIRVGGKFYFNRWLGYQKPHH